MTINKIVVRNYKLLENVVIPSGTHLEIGDGHVLYCEG